jgi:CheY-like chemotaxis protein
MNTPRSVAAQDWPTILLVEDEPSRGELLIEALREEGFGVVLAGDVRDALRQARACQPDLIVVDRQLTASVTRELYRLLSDPATRSLALIVTRRAAVCLATGGLDALPVSQIDVDLVRDHVWRAANTRVLRTPSGQAGRLGEGR